MYLLLTILRVHWLQVILGPKVASARACCLRFWNRNFYQTKNNGVACATARHGVRLGVIEYSVLALYNSISLLLKSSWILELMVHDHSDVSQHWKRHFGTGSTHFVRRKFDVKRWGQWTLRVTMKSSTKRHFYLPRSQAGQWKAEGPWKTSELNMTTEAIGRPLLLPWPTKWHWMTSTSMPYLPQVYSPLSLTDNKMGNPSNGPVVMEYIKFNRSICQSWLP